MDFVLRYTSGYVVSSGVESSRAHFATGLSKTMVGKVWVSGGRYTESPMEYFSPENSKLLYSESDLDTERGFPTVTGGWFWSRT